MLAAKSDSVRTDGAGVTSTDLGGSSNYSNETRLSLAEVGRKADGCWSRG